MRKRLEVDEGVSHMVSGEGVLRKKKARANALRQQQTGMLEEFKEARVARAESF